MALAPYNGFRSVSGYRMDRLCRPNAKLTMKPPTNLHAPTFDHDDPAIRVTPESDGRSTRVELLVDERSVSRCWIVSLTIRIGEAEVRMDGLGGVGTDASERRKGYARRVIAAALRRIESGDAALSMLYGIPDFYVQFGYVPAGPEHLIRMPAGPQAALPPGFVARAMQPDDLTELVALYARQTRSEVGAAVRPKDCYVHRRLREAAREDISRNRTAPGVGTDTHPQDRCRVLIGPDGALRGYAWRGDGFWATDLIQREAPDCMIVAEAIAADPEAAGALLCVCAAWAHEVANHTGRNIQHVLLSAPHDGEIGRAAMHRDAELIKKFTRCGGSMARVCDMQRLVEQLSPELRRRLADTSLRQEGPVTFVTGIGHATVPLRGRGAGRTRTFSSRTSWFTQAVLGAALPYEHVERGMVEQGYVRANELRWIRALFPPKCPHMYLPDRY